MEDSAKDWEELLARAWSHTKNVTESSARAKAVECFGRLMVRSTLFMCKKEKSGQEGLEHGSLANVLSLYEAEMGGKSAGATPVASAQAEPSDAAPATLENMQDPSFLMKLQGFAKGKLYKGKQKYQDMWPWKLEKISQSHGSFSLCCPVSWDKEVRNPSSCTPEMPRKWCLIQWSDCPIIRRPAAKRDSEQSSSSSAASIF